MYRKILIPLILTFLWLETDPAQAAPAVRVLAGDWTVNPLALPPGSFPLGWGSGQ